MPKSAKKISPDLAVLPSVDELLGEETAIAMISELGRNRVVEILRSLVAEKRKGLIDAPAEDHRPATRRGSRDEIIHKLVAAWDSEHYSGVRRVINATGVVIHTNLGRAPLSEKAVRAMAEAAGYSSIEYDIEKGSRGSRGAKSISLLKLLTGAEDALVVNNCAAAALLVLSVFAQGREVIVSRGELVEIGGDFRVPDILARSGAVLCEVGTTNRTHLRDYANAVSERTAMILKVHPSNFRITGFAKSQSTAELASLAQENNLLFYEDAGSGALIDLGASGIKDEPVIRDVIAFGADLVSFSGDKLLGGPQCGIIVGRAELVGRLRRDPIFRALRVDKTITAGLEATLESFVLGSAETEVPVLRMLAATEDGIAARSAAFLERLKSKTNENAGLRIELAKSHSAVGGGASPDSALNTTVIALTHSECAESELERLLRMSQPPVIARIEDGKVLIDLRTVAESEENELLGVVEKLFSGLRAETRV